MAKLTAAEKRWLKRADRLFQERPPRFGFYVIGDPEITIFDLGEELEIQTISDQPNAGDFCTAVEQRNAHLGSIRTGTPVYSTAG